MGTFRVITPATPTQLSVSAGGLLESWPKKVISIALGAGAPSVNQRMRNLNMERIFTAHFAISHDRISHMISLAVLEPEFLASLHIHEFDGVTQVTGKAHDVMTVIGAVAAQGEDGLLKLDTE